MVIRNRDITKRMNYFDRQFLRAQDFVDEQDYLIDRQRRLTRLLHTPGVAEGLNVTGTIDSNTVTVEAGTAIDAQGREIVLLAPLTVPMLDGVTSTIDLYITYSQVESDLSNDPGVAGKTRITEIPTFAKVPPDPQPTDGVLLARITLNNGQLTAEPDNTVRKRAGAIVSTSDFDDITVRSLTLKSDGVEPSQLPKLICSQANQTALQVSDLKLDNQREILFQGNGQIRSSDDNHKLVFNSQNNLLELHELGDISFLTGSPFTTEKMRILANGNVGIGTASLIPDTQLNVNSNDPNLQAVLAVSNSNADTRLGLWSGFNAGANSPAILYTHDLRFGTIPAANFPTGADFSEAMRITSEGKVGIGTTNPEHNLQIGNAANAVSLSLRGPDGNTQANIIAFEDNLGTAGHWLRLIHDTLNNALKITSTEVDPIATFLRTTGNVGIGTATPNQKLQVSGGNGVINNTFLGDVGFGSEWAGFSHSNSANTSGYGLLQNSTGTITLINIRSGGGSIEFHVDNVTKMSMDDSGHTELFGDFIIHGRLTKTGGGSFKIDHPLDPENKYLYHSFVESPDMKNIYDGVAVLNANGEAVVELPDWFEALNKDFRYQLTCIGGYAPVYIAQKIEGNRFKIAGGSSGMEVSWQVTGIRQDAWANAHQIPVEEEKSAEERGYYLHPTLHGESEEKSIQWARYPKMMQQSNPSGSSGVEEK